MNDLKFKNISILNIGNFIQSHFSLILVCMYSLAIIFPQTGILADKFSFLYINIPDIQAFNLTTPMVLLGIIVLNAAISINFKELLKLHKNMSLVILAILANFILGAIFFLVIKEPLDLFISPNNIQHIIIAIAILTAVPIAGTATAWTQNNKGNTALTLQILITTTLLSPVIAPLVFRFFSFFTISPYTEKILVLANKGAGPFLVIIVVIPAIIGLVVNHILKSRLIDKLMPFLRLSNQLSLIFLIYINASVILPAVIFENQDITMSVLCLVLATIYCTLSYLIGWVISIMLNSNIKDEFALIFSEGMKNVGAGLVIASFGFPEYRNIGLLIIFFAIVQQLLASFIRYFEYKKLIFIRNNSNKLACIIDPRCKSKPD